MAGCDCDLPSGIRPPRRGALARTVEQRELKRREQEASRQEVEKYYTQQKAFDHAAGNPLKEDIARKEREAKERTREAQLIDSLYQAERTKELALIRSEEEEKLATALVKRAHEKDRKEKEIQHLTAQSAELRELSEKIRAARVNKERALQLQEKAQIKQQQHEYDTAFNQFVEAIDVAAVAKEAEFQARRREQAVKARQVLEEQMMEKQDLMRQAELEAARERAMVDEILRRIAEEDAMSASLRRQRQDETKAYIAQFLADQEANKRAKKEADDAEDKKIQEYWDSVRQREAEEAARLAAKREAADYLYEKIKREMEAGRLEKEKEEELINMLRQEEAEEKRRQEDEARRRKAEDMKREIQRANQHQMRLKEEREANLRAEEEAFRAQMMAKFAEDDRVEQMNAQKRRMKLQEHQKAVGQMIEDRRRMYEEQKAREEAAQAQEDAEEARKRAIIEDERRALLREAAELMDYLPRGVLRDQQDLEFVRSHLAKTNLGGQGGSGNIRR